MNESRGRDGRVEGRGGWARARWFAAIVAMAIVGGLVARAVDGRPDVPELDERGWRAHVGLDFAMAVAAAPDGGMWVGTDSGELVRWDADGDNYERHAPDGLSGRPVTEVAVGGDGTVWAASFHSPPMPPGDDETPKVVRFDGERWTGWAAGDDGLLSAQVASLAVDDGTVWAATVEGLERFDGQRWTIPHTREDGSAVRPDVVTVDGEGSLWVVLRSDDGRPARVVRFDDGQRSAWTVEDGLPPGHLAGFTTGAEGHVWALTQQLEPDVRFEVGRFDGEQWATETTATDLLPGRRRSARARDPERLVPFAVDASGRPWVALHAAAGVAFFDGDGWVVHDRDDGLPDEGVGALVAGGDGVWAATSRGVGRFDGSGWQRYVAASGPADNRVADVAVAGDEAVWVAAASGPSRYVGQSWHSWRLDGRPVEEPVQHVAVGSDGDVWASTEGSVSRFDGEEWTTWRAGREFRDGRVGAVAAGEDGAVWVLMEKALLQHDGESWTTHVAEVEEGLAAPMTVDADGAVWTSTRSRALVRFDGTWTRFAAADGVASQEIYAIAADDRGAVWVGTDEGFARHDQRGWMDATTDGDPLELSGEEPVAHEGVTALAVDDADRLWAVADGRLAVFNGQQWASTDLPESAAPAWSVAAGDGAVWLATAGGLYQFDLDGG